MLEPLLERERPFLTSLVEREAGGLLRFEGVDDLVQGITVRALGSEFDYVDDARARAWLKVIARRHISDRHEYWGALRRGSGSVLRLTWGDSDSGNVRVPASESSGPASFAERRELIELAIRALDTLPERDRQLVMWKSSGVELREQARRLGLEYAACQRAGHRAVERFRVAFEVLAKP